MKYQPDYSIELSDGNKIPLLFNSWTFRTYSEKKGMEFEDLYESVLQGKVFKANNITDMVFIAAQSYCRFNRIECTYTEVDADEWMDEIGGLNSIKTLDVFKHFTGKILNIPIEKFEAVWDSAVKGSDGTPAKEEKGGKKKVR